MALIGIRLTICSPNRKGDDSETFFEGSEDAKPYRVISHYRYSDRHLMPHSIMLCLARIWLIEINQGLNAHELRAIVNMILRVNHKPVRG